LSDNELRETMTRLRWHHLARAARTLLACAALATCSPDAMAPGARVESVLDLASLLRAPGDLPIPIDEVVVELRRTADSSLAGAPQTIQINPANQSDTALRVTVQVEMSREQEDFYLRVEARGNNVLYFVVQSIITARKNRRSETAALVPTYVGPGANADDLEVSLLDADIPVGDSVLVTGAALQNEAQVPGTPIGFVSSQPAVVLVRRVAINQVWLIASPTAPTGSVPVTVSGPNGLSEQLVVNVVGSAPTGLHFVAVTTQAQNGVVNQLVATAPRVRLVDENDAAVPNAAVTFVTTAAGGTITDSVATTDTQGEASLGSWRLGTLVGSYAVNATAGGVTPLPFTAQAGPTTVASLVRISGDSQTAATSTALAQPLVIEARDTFANPLAAGPTITWSVTDGAITPSSQLNAQGRAQATWTLGATQAAPTATATLNGVTTIFSATTTFPNPTIQLSFSGIPGVGIGLTSRVRVALTTAAPAGGLVVSLNSAQPGIATVPTTVTVAAGQTVDSFLVTGVSAGAALITGSAAGYLDGTITVDVQLRNLNPSVTISVPYGQTVSLPITIPAPAPAGGITIDVASSAPTLVGVATPTVTIAAGGTSTSATLQGLLPGAATITVTNPAYNAGTAAATTAAALRMSTTSVSINASFGQAQPIDFVSNNIPIAAPSPGITITHDIATPTCVAVAPSPGTIATGLTSTSLTFTYGGTATLPCSSRVIFNAPNIQPDTVTVSVSAVPTINAPNVTAGVGLMPSTTINLGAGNHGGVLFSVISLDPTIATTSFGTNAPAADSVGFNITNGSSQAFIPIHGISAGVATLVAKAPGFITDTFTVTVVTPGIDINGLPAVSTTFSPNEPFVVRTGIPNGQNTALTQVQPVRFGVSPLTVTVTSGTPATGRLVTATEPGAASVNLTIDPMASSTPTSLGQGGVAFDPLAQGTTAVSASIPGFTTMTNGTVTVAVNAPTLNLPAATVAANLISSLQQGSLNAGNHGGTTIWLRSSNPAVMLVSLNASTAGTDSIAINMLNGSTNFSYYVQGTGGQVGSAYLVANVPGFTPDSALITVPQASYDITGLTASMTNLAANDPFAVRVGYGTTGGLSAIQSIRPGGTPLVATVTNSNAAAADLVTQALTAEVVTVTIPVGSSASGGTVATGGVEFDPIAGGTTAVSASIPGLLATTNATVNVTITATPITINNLTVGSGLMAGGGGSVGGSAQHGGVTVVVKPLNPAVARIAPDNATAADDSLVIALPNGSVNFSYYLHGMDGVVDSTPLIAYATGFTPDTSMVRVPQAGFDISSLTATYTTQTVNDLFMVRLGVPNAGNTSLSTIQNRRFGGTALTTTVTNGNAAIADLVTTGGPADQATAQITAGTSSTPATLAAGGIEFDPIGAGSTTVSATIPGYLAMNTATVNVTITAPVINISSTTVGAGLATTVNAALGSSNHPADSVTLTSSQPSVLLLAKDLTSPGSASIRIPMAANATNFSFVAMGVEGQTGAPLITAEFPGFTDGTTTGTVRPAGIDISGLTTSFTTTSADDGFIARIGPAAVGNGSLSITQPIRFGGTPLTVTVTSSNAAVGRVKTSTDSGASVTVSILVGQSSSPSGTGGVSFDPLSAGNTTVAVSAPGYVTVTTGSVATVVATPTITLQTITVGGGLQTTQQVGNLSGPVPAGGGTVTLTSANGSLVQLAPDAITAGTNSIDIPLAAGVTSFNYIVSAPVGATGTANITATMTGFTGDTRLVTVVQPGFQIASLSLTTTVAAANDEFVVQIGVPNTLGTGLSTTQQVRWGGTQLVVTVDNSDATTAQLVTTAGAGQNRTIPVFVGANTTPLTVAAGGVAFDGLVAGTTTVRAAIPGFVAMANSSQNITVNP
jgi:hypothetical protein